jgi:hypothetical protein
MNTSSHTLHPRTNQVRNMKDIGYDEKKSMIAVLTKKIDIDKEGNIIGKTRKPEYAKDEIVS